MMKNKIEKHVGSHVIIKLADSRRTISGVLKQPTPGVFQIKLGVNLLPVDPEKVHSITPLL